jgi:predicted nuclease of predicted toxin-antitoxin system
MKILVDMNLPPAWCGVLSRGGHEAVHWSEIGDGRAPDAEIMEYAASHEYVVFTHDLDFGALLAATQASRPSVIQVRTQDVMPAHLEKTLLAVLAEHASALESGAIIVVDERRSRIRFLPLRR